MDQRKVSRVSLQAPVSFQWSAADGVRFEAEGITLDLSAEGIQVLCFKPCPSAGSTIVYELTLELTSTGISGLHLKAIGKVVRSHELADTGAVSFAARADVVLIL